MFLVLITTATTTTTTAAAAAAAAAATRDFKQTTTERSSTVAGSKISKKFCNTHVCLSRIAVARFPTTLGTAAGRSVRYVVFCCQSISSLLL